MSSNLPVAPPKFDEASLEAELRSMGLDDDAVDDGGGGDTLFRRGNTDYDITNLMASACASEGQRPAGLSWASSNDTSLNDPTLLKELAAMSEEEEEEDPEKVNDKVVQAAMSGKDRSSKASPTGPTSDELMESLGLQDDDDDAGGGGMAVVEAAEPHACELLVSLAVMEWYLGEDAPIQLTDEEREELTLQVRTLTLDAQSGRLSSEKYAERVEARITADEALLEHLGVGDHAIVEKRITIAKNELAISDGSGDDEGEDEEGKYEEYRTVVMRRFREYQRGAAALAGAGVTGRARDLLHSAVELKELLEGGAKQCRLAVKEGRVAPSLTDEILMGQSEVDRRAVIAVLENRLREASQEHREHALFCLNHPTCSTPAHGQVPRRLAAAKQKPEEADAIKKLKDEAVMHNTLRKNAEVEIAWLEDSRADRWQFVPNELEKRSVKYTRLNEDEDVEEMGHLKVSLEIPSETMRCLREWSEDYPMHLEVTIHGLPSASDPYVFSMELLGSTLDHDFDFSHMRQTTVERAFGKAKITVKVFRQRNALASLFGNSLKEIGSTPSAVKLEGLQTHTHLEGDLVLAPHTEDTREPRRSNKRRSSIQPIIKVRCRLRAPANRSSWLTVNEYTYCVLPTPLPPTIKDFTLHRNKAQAQEAHVEEDDDTQETRRVVDPLVSPLDPSLWVSVEAIEDRLQLVVDDEEEKEGLETRRGRLVDEIQSGALSFDDYVQSMRRGVESDIKLAIQLKRLNRTHEAAVVYKRAKIMREALQTAAAAEEDEGEEGV
ncbi:hypothetical protein FOZ62_017197 [Perkinsus olseni]|uniref:Uncharacterized protein n=1 Tax=Perkinsus olseni TaxID=32597 RepID=A0A7J6RE95_PEROL|nr:hypothetical protein FOZ62_017197 [Perkinsus olseni]